MTSISSSALATVLESMVAVAEAERSQSTAYQSLFKRSDSLAGLLRGIDDAGSQVMLDGCSILERKRGIKMTREIMDFLLAVPYLASALEREIVRTQGTCCCVDKVFYHLADELERLVQAAPKKPQEPPGNPS